MFSKFLLNKIIKYKKKTLNKTAVDILKSKNKLVKNRYRPTDLDYEYTEMIVKTDDNLTLKGWYIENKNATKTIIMVHGRKSNKMALVKYLQIFKDINLDYNIAIFDLRNSGESDTAITGLGYFFSKDIYSILKTLNLKTKINKFILYGFSQGAMACMLNSKIYYDKYKEMGIEIEKIILDSPLANAIKTINTNAKIFGIKIPSFFLITTLLRFNNLIDDNLEMMKLSKLVTNIPTLILQSEQDKITTFDIFKDEYEKIKSKENMENIKFKIFRNGFHVRMYLIYRWEYTNEIKEFLMKG